MRERATYVGVGECECRRFDIRLYHVPGTPFTRSPVCARCLGLQGYEEPVPRTERDVEEVNGTTAWKRTTGPLEPTYAAKLDLGHGHLLEAVIDMHNQLVGWLHTHPDTRTADNPTCQSFCAVRPLDSAPVHQVVCADPLTLFPSLLCRACGARGNVTNGIWEPCRDE